MQYPHTAPHSGLQSTFCAAVPPVMTPAPTLPELTIYKTGTRQSRSSGQTIYIYEFTLAPKHPLLENRIMDMIESFIASTIVKALHSAHPTLTPDDDAKVTKAVGDFVATAMDLVAVYFAIRNAK